MPGPTVTTIILNWRTPDMTVRSIEAALREMAQIDGEIVVVDNDSQDGSFEMLLEAVQDNGWERVRVLQTGHNGGFGAGNNYAIREALAGHAGYTPDYFYILNSDAFPDNNAIISLFNYLKNNDKIGLAGSYIHGPDGDAHLTTFRFPSIASEFEGAIKFGPITRWLRDAVVPVPTPEESGQVDWLAGASLMVRSDVLKDIGLFDENFFLYFEETDLCRRAALAGWETHFVAESSVTHIGSVSTGMKTWDRIPSFWLDSRFYYFRQNHGLLYAYAATAAHLTGGFFARCRGLFQRKTASEPKFFLIDMAYHALKEGLLSMRPRPRKVTVFQVNRQSEGEQA